MDAAQSSFKKLVFFLATALLLSAPFRASATSAPTLSASTTNFTIGSASCNDFQTVTLTSSGGANSPIAFTVAIKYGIGDVNGTWLYATTPDSNGGTTSTSQTINGSTGTAGSDTVQIGLNRTLGSSSDTGSVIVTPINPAGSAITITVNYVQNSNCGNTGSTGNNYITVSPSNIALSAALNGQTSQTVTLQNISSAVYVIDPTVQNSWLSVSTSPITLTPTETYNLSVSANASATSGAGTYSGALVLTPASGYGGNIINIPVTFTVGSGTGTGTSGGLTVNGGSNTTVTFNYLTGASISGNCVNLVDNTSGVTGYSWNVSTTTGGNWLFGPNNTFSGSTPQLLASGTPGPPCINLSVNTSVAAILASGAYQGTVTVTDNVGGSASITANLYVSSGAATGITVSPGTIYAFSNVASGSTVQQQATFTVSGGSGYNLGSPSLSNSSGDFSISTPTTNPNSVSFTITTNSTGLVTGLYSATVTVPSNYQGGANSNTVITIVQPVGQAGTTVTGGTTTTVAPNSLSFQQQTGSQFWIGQSEAQALSISGPQGTTWNANIVYTGGTPQWLSFDNSATSGTFGSGPVTLLVDLFNGVGSMAASNSLYQATVQINTQNSGQISVPVTLLVTPSNTPVLLGLPASTTFSANSGTTPASQTVSIVGSDNPYSTSTTTPAITAGVPTASWLTATASGNQLTLGVNLSGLTTGLYSAAVPVSSSGAYAYTINYPVALVVNGGGGGTGSGPLTLSSTALTYTNVTGAITQNLSVTASSSTQFSLTSSESNCTGANWLQVTNGGYVTPATQISVTVNPSGISNGTTCVGSIALVTGSGTSAVTQTVSVSMAVGTASGTGNVTVSPTTLSFPYTQGQSAPAAQTVTIINANSGTASIPFSVGITENNGGSWLKTNVTSAQTPYNNPGLSISVVPGSLSPNTYTGTVTITPTGGTPVSISVTMTIAGEATVTATPTSVSWNYTVGSTAPTAAIQVSAGGAAAGFTATATSQGGWLQVSPTSGTTPNAGTFNLSVSTVASALAALAPQAAAYTGTITVQGVTQGNVQATGTTMINVSLTVSAPLPVISGIINTASGVGGTTTATVSPGEIISLFAPTSGQNPIGPATAVALSSSTCPSPCSSVPTSMGGVQVLFLPGNFQAPLLYVSANQINAVVPYEVAGIGSLSVEVRYLNQSSNTFPLTVATTNPGIFTAVGSEQAAAYEYDTQGNGNYNSSANPAKAGWTLVLYVTGEGVVIPAAATGSVTASSTQTPVPAAGKPNVIIGTQPATLSFYGEAPTFVSGLMQLNVIVPPGAGTGAVPISITIGGHSTQSGATVYLQ